MAAILRIHTTVKQKMAFTLQWMLGRMHFQGRASCGGMLSLCSGREIKQQQKAKTKIHCGLQRPPIDIFHSTTNQRHAGTTEETYGKRIHQRGMHRGMKPLFWGALEAERR
jgi:hypothetical protein